MILYKLGSPAFPALGWVWVIGAFGASLFISLQTMALAYIRWADVEAALRFLLFFLAMGIAVVVSFNVSALYSPKTLTNSPLGKRPILIQIRELVACPTLVGTIAVIAGISPLLFKAIIDSGTISIPFLLVFLSCIAFLFVVALASALLAFTVRSLHPIIAVLLSAITLYLFLFLKAILWTTWLISPAREVINAIPTQLNYFNSITSLLSTILFATGLACIIVLAHVLSQKKASLLYLPIISVSGLSMVFFTMLGIDYAVGAPAETENDLCQNSHRGTEICFGASDAPAMATTLEDINRLEEIIPHVHPVQIAELQSFASSSKPEYIYSVLDRETGRPDLTNLAAHHSGYAYCEDPSTEPAEILERLTVHFINQAEVYSKKVEEYGALSLSFAITGTNEGELIEAVDTFAQVNQAELHKLLAENWDFVRSCQATNALFEKLPFKE